MKFDLNLTITGIIALVALCSPIIVTFINNKHDYNVKQLEFDNKIKQEVLSKFALNVTKVFDSNFIEYDFYHSLNLLYIYFEVDDEIIEKITTYSFGSIELFQQEVAKLMRSLSKQIKSK